jgi:hypothetical protein
LSEENQSILDLTTFDLPLTVSEIEDTTDYNTILNDINDIDQILDEVNKYKLSQEMDNNISEDNFDDNIQENLSNNYELNNGE